MTKAPEFLRRFSEKLRAGYSVAQILGQLENELTVPVAKELHGVNAAIASGTSIPEALDAWLARAPSPELQLTVGTLAIQRANGGNLADKFDLLQKILSSKTA